MNRKLAVLVLVLMLALALAACGQPDNSGEDGPNPDAALCRVRISCANALAWEGLDEAIAELQPEDGTIVDAEVAIADGDTAFDALIAALQDARLAYEIGDGYFSSVNSLKEGACGDMSGWLYSVNGEMPMTSADEYVLEAGDLVKLEYSCDFGADLGFSLI